MKIYNVQINHLTKPTGIDGRHVYVSWNLEGGMEQKYYRIRVNINFPKEQVLEDSGKIPGSQMHYSIHTAIPFRSKAIVNVTVWDENDQESEESIEIVTGIGKNEWKAKWINPELKHNTKARNPASYLKKTFQITKEQQNLPAFLYITAHGIVNVYINGNSVTEKQLMPGTTQVNKRLMVETLEISSYLNVGKNEIVCTLGDGWYRGCVGYDQVRNVFGKDVALLAQMEIQQDVVVSTDESWEASQNGPLGLNDLMAGEAYDARREAGMTYHPVSIENFGFDNLICADTVPMIRQETFEPVLIKTPAGETVLDFGQNLAGYIELHFNGISGQQLTLIHGEVLDENGNFTIHNFQNGKVETKQQIDYICKDGENIYHPTKTYMGFRYVKVIADFPVKAGFFKAVAVYSDMRVTADFSCGNEKVNRLFQNALWSMKGNFVDVPTDCPTREKAGYSGDCQAFVHTAMYLMDCYAVYAKWLREQAATQFENGVVAQIAPSTSRKKTMMDGGIGWSDAIDIVPYKLMSRYGDDTLIKELYPVIKRWVQHLIRRAQRTKLFNYKNLPGKCRKYMLDTGWMWGEWLEPGQDSAEYMKELILHNDPEVGTAYLYYDCVLLKKMAEKLGIEEDVKYFDAYSQKVKDAYRLVYAPDGAVKEKKRQCRYVRPLYMGLLNADEKRTNADALAKMIQKNRNKLNTGFLTTHELCRVLSKNGNSRTAYDLLLQEEQPGWLYAVTKGCTTIPESWNCYDENGKPDRSFNHYSYGAIVGWLIDGCCGINEENGEIVIEPHPDTRLGYAKAAYQSPVGRIVSEWKYNGEKVSFHVEVPANTKAVIQLPNQESIEVKSGSYDF